MDPNSVGELFHYTCDKQVLWESAGAFFPRDNLFHTACRTFHAFVV